MKTDIIERINQALAENRQVKQQRMQAHVMWLLDNPTQLPIKHVQWDQSTTATTDQDLEMIAFIDDQVWKFTQPDNLPHLCVRCLSSRVDGDHPWCNGSLCSLYSPDPTSDENVYANRLHLGDLARPLHRGHVFVQPMVADR